MANTLDFHSGNVGFDSHIGLLFMTQKERRERSVSKGRCYVCQSRTRLPRPGNRNCDSCNGSSALRTRIRRNNGKFTPANLRWLEE